MLHPVLWNTVISTDNKRLIFRSIVEPSLNYAAETWIHNPGLYSKLQAAEMDYWKRYLRITRLNRVRNEYIRSRLGVTKRVPERIGKNRLQLYGHCQRMSEHRWPKRLLKWNLQEDGGEQDSEHGRRTVWRRELEEEEWLNREKWREGLT
ncbi:uncharacterized protein [Halyomorpha halys]|uniref:uncharacterized protein n=1 Tax=Halyomorpha halys TaxID=286706 RepID=UPI0006D4E011|nr:uncharacterized protein LOC106687681 [Halyomorpha halys]